jgi:16S rRNA (guanine527-N7)-methyltransferase
MEAEPIAALLAPYLESQKLSSAQLEQISTYVKLLVKWNARMNLTAVRDPELIVTRHFGESLFAAHQLFPDLASRSSLIDVGSGAGFPGLPIAILRPEVRVTLIEAHAKKATFLKEVARSTGLKNLTIAAVRAESFAGIGDVVTFRAVERFEAILPVCARLVAAGGRLAALVGSPQVADAKRVIGRDWRTEAEVNLLGSTQRVLWISRRRDG